MATYQKDFIVKNGLQVGGDILPSDSESYDLGSSTYKFKDLHLSGTTIYLGDLQLKDNGAGELGLYQSDGETIATASLNTSSDNVTYDNTTSGLTAENVKAALDEIVASISTEVANLINSAPETLDTLYELAAALGDDANFATTVTDALAGKVGKINITGGSVGSSTEIPVITYNTQGQITSASTTSITVGDGTITVQGSNGLNGSGSFTLDQSGPTTITLSHDTYDGDDISVDTGALTGANVISDLDFNVTTDGYGHVTDANAAISTRALTLADLGYTGETDATADQTAEEILTAIKTVDGANSGLDADTVDGIQAAALTQSGDSVALTGDVTGSTTVGADGSISITTTVGDDSHNHIISNVDGLQTALDGKEPADATILKDADIGVTVEAYDSTILKDADIGVTVEAYDANIVSDANYAHITVTTSSVSDGTTTFNKYVHPSYDGDDINVDTTALTGATVVSDIDINVTTDASGHVTDANGSVATRTLTLADLGYTGTTDANTYVHPSYAGDDFSVDTGALTGATVVSDIDINVTTDASGHVTDANGSVATRTLTLADLGYTGSTTADNYSSWTIQDGDTTTYTVTSGDTLQVAAGDGISSNFTADDVLTITNTAPNVTTNITTTHNASTVVVNSSDGTDGTINAATTSLAGVMSGADKTKLDGIATSANNYTHPSYAGDDFSVDTGALTGATVVSDIDINVTTDASGHVTDANGSIATRTLTLADLGYTGATNANYYTHPTYTARTESCDTGTLTGATVISDLDFNITTDTSGHVTACDVTTVSTRNITYSDVGAAASSHTHSYVPLSGGTTTGQVKTTNTTLTAGYKNITVSSSGPSGGISGDVWFDY